MPFNFFRRRPAAQPPAAGEGEPDELPRPEPEPDAVEPGATEHIDRLELAERLAAAEAAAVAEAALAEGAVATTMVETDRLPEGAEGSGRVDERAPEPSPLAAGMAPGPPESSFPPFVAWAGTDTGDAAQRAGETGGQVVASMPAEVEIVFDGITEEWRLRGRMHGPGQLGEVLRGPDPIAILEVLWAPLDGSEPFTHAPGLKRVYPRDFLAVSSVCWDPSASSEEGVGAAGDAAGPSGAAGPSDDGGATGGAGSAASTTSHDLPVEIDLGTIRVTGAVALPEYATAERLLHRSGEPFFRVTRAAAYCAGRVVSDSPTGVIFVNRDRVWGLRGTG